MQVYHNNQKGSDSMFRSCVHTHTYFCDGKDAPEAMVLEALDRGFVSLGFSGHGWADYDIASMTPEKELQYRAEIQRLQQVYVSQIEILLGLEHDSLMPYPDFPYEYLIESLHYIAYNGEKLSIDWTSDRSEGNIRKHFGGDPYGFTTAYFNACAAAYEKSPAQIAGHIDLVSKFNEGGCMFDEEDPRYLAPAKEAMACAVERGMVVELNTGAISRGYRTAPYPSIPLLCHLKDLGGRVIVTSDCHNKAHLTCFYDEAAELLKACGFRSTLVLRKQGFVEEAL